MINVTDNRAYVLVDEEKWNYIHKKAFEETYSHIKEFGELSYEINNYMRNYPKESHTVEYMKKTLCSPPGHGKTTALEVHIKQEILQTKTVKSPYLLVFFNEDNLREFEYSIIEFAEKYMDKLPIISVTERNVGNVLNILEDYQIVCITQQRFRDIGLGFGTFEFYKYYQQEPILWGKNDNRNQNIKRKMRTKIERTVIVDEMPIFFNEAIFDIGKDDNMLDWYDVISQNTSDEIISPDDKDRGRRYLSDLFNNALKADKTSTIQFINFYKGKREERELLDILSLLNTKNISSKYLARKEWFENLLNKEGTGVLIKTSSKTIVLCCGLIDYGKVFGNILILDGSANLTSSIYKHTNYEIINAHNYNDYRKRLGVQWMEIGTTSSQRNDKNKQIKEQISESIKSLRSRGVDILPIPSLSDKEFYIQSGAITQKQYEMYFKEKIFEDENLAINLLNTTGKNGLSSYRYIALLNLPILPPQVYRLQAIAIYGTDTDLRLVKELPRKEQDNYKGKWFVDPNVQELFEQNQKAILSQIIHRTAIRNLNSTERVVVFMYHKQPKVTTYLEEIFGLVDKEDITKHQLYLSNRFRTKCHEFADIVELHLRNIPNQDVTVSKSGGGNKFVKFMENYWKTNSEDIISVFAEHNIQISEKGKKKYRMFTYIDNGIFEDIC